MHEELWLHRWPVLTHAINLLFHDGGHEIDKTILMPSNIQTSKYNKFLYIYIYMYIYNYGSTQTYTKLKVYNHPTPKYSKGIWEWKEH